MIDLHVHTHYSCDSKTSIKEYCDRAMEIGVKAICFTDHIDFNKEDYGYGFYDSKSFLAEFERCRERYSGKLLLLCGVEFSEPHVYKKEFEGFQRLPYDFVLGSIHFWMDDLFPSEMVERGIPVEEAFEKYWTEVYKAVSYGGFDSLAHFDFPKRYYKNCLWTEETASEIFKAMIKNNISLEINTSSLRKGLDETMPGAGLLDSYRISGGKYVTFGADTHTVDELASGYLEASALMERFESVIYIKRKKKLVKDIFL